MKEKLPFFISIILIMFFFLNSVYAEDIEIIVPEKTITTYAGRTNRLEVLVKNNRDVRDTFYFSIWPTYWISLGKYFTSLNAGEITNLSLSIEPPRDVQLGTIIFTLIVRSVDYNVSASEEIYFDIVRTSNVFLTDLKINKQSFKPGETVNIQPTITNIDKKETTDVFLTMKILKDNKIVQTFEDTLSVVPQTTETLSHNYNLKITNPPGGYEVEAVLKNKLNKILDKDSITFNIETLHKIDEEKKTENSILFSTVTIKILNNGNVVESNLEVTESLPLISKYFFYPEIEPVSEEEKENRIVYKWLIHDLKPDEIKAITYQLRFTNVVLISCLLIIVVVWVVWLFFRPTIRKTYMGLLARENQISISLHLKNKSRKLLKNVQIVDFVPPLAAVVKKFDTLEPNIKTKTTGTELTWKIKELKPKEERVLTYKIKPVIDIIGKLRLPKAHLIYKTKKGKRRRVLSKTMTMMGKVK
jgi:hypothetical protein